MDHLFAIVPGDRLYVLSVGIAEVVSILVRKKNAGRLTATEFAQALFALRIELVPSNGPRKVDANTALAVDALPLIATHSINGTDAMILRSAMDLATTHRVDGDDLVLVTSDQRLLRAAQAEGLATFNPETQDQTALAALLGP